MAVTNKGWVKIWRKITEDSIWTSEQFTKGQAWVDLLLFVSATPQSVFYRGSWKKLPAGCVFTKNKDLAERWKWSQTSVRRFLKYLQDASMITYETSRLDGTIIQILKWTSYQAKTANPGGEQSAEQSGERTGSDKTALKPQKSSKNGGKTAPKGTARIDAGEQNGEQNGEPTILKKNNKEVVSRDSDSSLGTIAPKGVGDIPIEFRDDFDTYEAYDKWRNQ